MKKKILLFIALISMLACFFAISISAETPTNYIEFGARFPGSDEYITVYTENAESTGNPRIDFASKKFYSDVDFTQEVDMSTATGIDFSVAKTYASGVQGKAPTRMVKPSSPFVNCVEVKWFLEGMPTVSYNGSFFQGWTGLKSFDFGNATAISDNTFQGCGFESITIPASVTSFGGSAFKECTSLKSVVIEGNVTKFGNGSTFHGCTNLSTVTLGDISYIPSNMFNGCTALSTINLPSTITEIGGSAFSGCSSLTSVTIPENVTTIGSCAFYKTGLTSLHIPAKVTYLGYQVAESSAIQSLTFAQGSELKHIDHRAFRDCLSLAGTVVIPEGVEDIEYGLFHGCTSLKAVKLPSTFSTSTQEGSLFSGCTALEFVQMSGCVATIPSSMFENCYALKAISFPEGVETISYKALRKCTSLQAVYLPSSLTSLGKSSGNTASDWGVFYQSPNVYLVNEPFDVFEGDAPLGDNFVMPEKPEVYYMPQGLTVVGNSEFQDCTNLNNYIVFPVGVTSMADCNQGAFCNIGKNRADNPVTLVFLGDMTALNIRQNDTTYSNIHYVFANPNDTDLSCLTVTIGAANNKTQTNTYMYFCKGKVSYDLSTFVTANGTAYTVQETDYTKTTYTDNQPHFVDPKKTIETDPTCVDNVKATTYCFCDAVIGTSEVENTALGHNHSIFLDLIYLDFSQAGYYSYQCERCEDVNNDKSSPALFTNQGYSTQEYSNGGVQVSFMVHYDAIENYNTVKGTNIKYGIFAVSKANAQGKQIVNADGTGASGVACADFSARTYDIFAIRVIGFKADATYMEAQLALGAYVIDGEKVSYMQVGTPADGNTYCYTSYNEQNNA
ncbi:MAG: leucine-rich repeat protein [Clostridia bacterium]|nr:leucine-rich repeat protein [Clostridia bacterium]